MKFPIFIPSKGRFEKNLTAELFIANGLDFTLVVEDHEVNQYISRYGKKRVHNLGGRDYGCVAHARNVMKRLAEKQGSAYHWQIDDDLAGFFWNKNRKSVDCQPAEALQSLEEIVDQYTNIAYSCFGSSVFGKLAKRRCELNKSIFTCKLVKTDTPFWFAHKTIEDLDYTLQCLIAGYCTLKINNPLFKWSNANQHSGGYTELDLNNNGEYRRCVNTIKRWPGILSKIVTTHRKSGVSQQIDTRSVWRRFNQKPIKREN